MVLDPVCTSEVDEHHARGIQLMLERNGQWYFFCSEQCKRDFELNWQEYLVPWSGGWENTGAHAAQNPE